MNVTKIANLLQREEARSVESSIFNRDNHEACAHQMNVEEAKNGDKRTLAKLVNNKYANENH